jgi:excisionase family DNA binding protein
MMETKIVAMSVSELTEIVSHAVRMELQELVNNPVLGDSFTDELWDRKQAAAFLGVSEQTLTKVYLEGKLVGQKSGRKYHFLKSSVLKFLKSN